MALNDLEKKRIERAASAFMKKRRPPIHIRAKLDLGYSLSRQSVELFEIRPAWNNPNEILNHSFAKATYVQTQKVWKIFWMKADLKWHSYPGAPKVRSIEEFFDIVNKDAHCCFFG